MRSSGAFLAKILRLPLSLIPRETEVCILRGPLRGMKWIKGAGPNAYWFGTYEVSRVRAFANMVTPGATVYALPGHHKNRRRRRRTGSPRKRPSRLAEFHPAIFLEIHGTQLHADCRAFLSQRGYHLEEAYAQLIATTAHDASLSP